MKPFLLKLYLKTFCSGALLIIANLLAITLTIIVVPQKLNAQCNNRALDFDGINDFVDLPSLRNGQSTFSLEVNFKSTNPTGTSCSNTDLTNFRWLFSWDDDKFGIGDCNGRLALIHEPTCASSPFVCNIFPPLINDNNWHCLGLSQTFSNLEVYLDGNLISTLSTLTLYDLSGNLRIGSSGTGTVGKTWLGQVDEFKIWGTPSGSLQFANACICPGEEPQARLLTYYSFDQGVPSGNNTGISIVVDGSGKGNDGQLQNFAMGNPLVPPASIGNFVCGNTAGFTPYLAGTNLEIKDFLPLGSPISEICSGDAVHFCLLDDSRQSPPPSSNVNVEWEMNEGAGWAIVPSAAFAGYCFTVPKNEITANCGAGSAGAVAIAYRAKFEITDNSGASCTMYSEGAQLNICCPISDANVTVTSNIMDDLLCQGDAVIFTVSLSSPDYFVSNLGPQTHISWKYNGLSIPFDDQLNFNYPVAAAAAPGACFEATITNCSKSRSFSSCITVDKEPQCGTITSFSPITELMPDPLGDPNLFYICPGDDGVLGMVNSAAFYDCNWAWQRTFTPGDPASWVDIGASNTIQNTNTLSSYYWSGQTEIFYRVICRPKSDPSGCDPKYSNILQVKLKPNPLAVPISGPVQVCIDNVPVSLTLSAFTSGETYEWFCNGLSIGTGPVATLSKNACYWAEISNGCPGQTVETPRHCLEVCKIQVVLECPKNENGGPCIGLDNTVTLRACASSDNCSGPLDYAWTASNGGPGLPNGCEFVHLPEDTGTTYTVTVTNTLTGCLKTVQTTVVPCDEN